MIRIVHLVVGVVALGYMVPALADGEVEYKYRQSVMKSVGGHMGAMGGILKNQVHLEDLALHARGLAALSEIAPKVFPDGSNVDKSKAKAAIWENPEDFNEKMSNFGSAAKKMAAAAESGEMSQIGPAIQGLGGTCKGCHDDYKAD
jgi:cytochrome c556